MKLGEFKGFTNPVTNEGMRALAIVLGVLVVIAGIVYVANANFGKGKESTIVTVTPQPTIPTKIPTITPLTKEKELSASPSATVKVRKPTETLTPTVKGATVSPTLIK